MAGNGPLPVGSVSVPGSAHSPLPTVTSCSVYADGFAYDGGVYGTSRAAGRIARPAMRLSAEKASWTSTAACANAQGVITIRLSPATRTRTSVPQLLKGPTCATSESQVVPIRPGG